MKVILKDEVDNLGLAGDVVDVADGYGRNFLIPRGLAILASKGAMKEADALTRSRKAAEAKTLGSAESSREILESRTLKVTARCDERGNLYGSVSANDVQRVLKERGHDIPRKRIDLKGNIKVIGAYEVPVQVHPQVIATVQLEVSDEEGNIIPGQAVTAQAPLPIPEGQEAPEGEEAPTDAAETDGAEEALVAEAVEKAAAFEREQAAEAGVDEAGGDTADEVEADGDATVEA